MSKLLSSYIKLQGFLQISSVVVLTSLAIQAFAEQSSFVTVVDANGNLVNVPVANSTPQNSKQSDSAITSTSLVANAASQTSVAEEKTEVSVDQVAEVNKPLNQTSVQTSADSQNNQAVYQLDTEQYIDSDALANQGYNSEGRERFYSIPLGIDGVSSVGGVEQISRKAGVIQAVNPTHNKTANVSVSTNYQALSPEALVNWLPESCVPIYKLNINDDLVTETTANYLPRSAKYKSSHKNQDYDLPVELFELKQGVTTLELISYAQKSKNPKYYWPLIVFLDEVGCVQSGVMNFHKKTLPSSWISQSALQGYMVVPKDAKYVMLTPLQNSPDIPDIKLQDTGSIQISVIN